MNQPQPVEAIMKLPDTRRKRALIVIDLQPAFIKPHNKHIVHEHLSKNP